MKFLKDAIPFIIFFGIIILWMLSGSIKGCHPDPEITKRGRDTVKVTDTVTVPGKPITLKKKNYIPAKIDSATSEVWYDDSLQGTTESGSYDIKHKLMIQGDSAQSFWEVKIDPIEKVITNNITETIFKDVISYTDKPFYENIWFYISVIVAMVGSWVAL